MSGQCLLRLDQEPAGQLAVLLGAVPTEGLPGGKVLVPPGDPAGDPESARRGSPGVALQGAVLAEAPTPPAGASCGLLSRHAARSRRLAAAIGAGLHARRRAR